MCLAKSECSEAERVDTVFSELPEPEPWRSIDYKCFFFFPSMLALAARYLCLAREHRLSPSLSRSSSSPHSCRSVHRAEAEFAFLVRAALVLCWLRGCRSCASRRSSSLPALSLPLSLSWALLFIYLFAREGARAHVHRARPSVSVSVSFSLKWGKIINKIRGVTLTSWRSLARG